MDNKKHCLIGLLLTSICTLSTVHAEPSGYYRWKDQDGNLKLSDRPPAAGIKAEFIETPGSRKSRSSSTEPSPTVEPTTEQAQAPLKMELVPDKDPERCKQAQENMKAFEGFTRIRITEEDGTQRLLTEEEKNVQIERSQKAIKENCN